MRYFKNTYLDANQELKILDIGSFDKTGDYNYFISFVKDYIKDRYPFDFYRISVDHNVSKELDDMKKR